MVFQRKKKELEEYLKTNDIYYLIIYLHNMSTTVYSIRIPKKIRKAMEKMRDIDWQEEIRKMIIKRV